MLKTRLEFVPALDGEFFAQLPAAPAVFELRGEDAGSEPYVTKTANLKRRLQRLLGEQGIQSVPVRDRDLTALNAYRDRTSKDKIMPARASHIPAYRERSILQMLQERGGELHKRQLQPAAVTINKMMAKGWIEVTEPSTYRITAAGIAAMKAKI